VHGGGAFPIDMIGGLSHGIDHMKKQMLLFAFALMVPVFAAAATVEGAMAPVEFTDNMRLAVRTADGKTIEAYCDRGGQNKNGCHADWFVADKDGVGHLKKSMLGAKVTLRYSAEKVGDRLEGPDTDDVVNFVKELRITR
jgi:hypothetical protein